MLHRVLASLLCVLGAAALALGIASATVWRADDVLVADATAAEGTTMIVTEPGVLDLAADQVTVTATVPRGEVVVALARSGDVDAWVGTDAHTRVTGLARWHELATGEATPAPAPTPTPTDGAATPAPEAVAPAPTATPTAGAADAADAAAGAAAPAVDPRGSDLWVSEKSGTGRVTMPWTRTDGRWSVLIAATEAGVRPTVSLAWPQVVTTPWLLPGVVGGVLLLLAGMAWWAMILLAHRRPARPAATAVPARPVGAPTSARNAGARASAGAATAGPAVPLTRRQLREQAEHDAATRRGRPGRRRAEPPAAPEPEPSPPPVLPPAPRPGTPSASADAWRRAWGLGGSSTPPADDSGEDRMNDWRPTDGGAR